MVFRRADQHLFYYRTTEAMSDEDNWQGFLCVCMPQSRNIVQEILGMTKDASLAGGLCSFQHVRVVSPGEYPGVLISFFKKSRGQHTCPFDQVSKSSPRSPWTNQMSATIPLFPAHSSIGPKRAIDKKNEAVVSRVWGFQMALERKNRDRGSRRLKQREGKSNLGLIQLRPHPESSLLHNNNQS